MCCRTRPAQEDCRLTGRLAWQVVRGRPGFVLALFTTGMLYGFGNNSLVDLHYTRPPLDVGRPISLKQRPYLAAKSREKIFCAPQSDWLNDHTAFPCALAIAFRASRTVTPFSRTENFLVSLGGHSGQKI